MISNIMIICLDVLCYYVLVNQIKLAVYNRIFFISLLFN